MTAASRVNLIQDVLGSAHILSTAVNDLMQDRLRHVVGEQLTFSQIQLLKLVARTDAYNISQVASYLGVSNAAASKAVDRLVRRGLVTRSEAEGDRRAVELALTDEARRILVQYEAVTAEVLEEIFGGFTTEGLRKIADHLDQLSISLIDHNGHTEESCFRCGMFFREKCLLRGQKHRSCHFFLTKPGTAEDNGRSAR